MLLRLRPIRLTTSTTLRVLSPYLSTNPTRPYASKSTQNKDSLNPSRSEYTQTGKDDNAAHTSAAFDPSNTSPEGQKESAKREAGGDDKKNPLDVSPGNKEVSKPRKDDEGGAQGSPRTSRSGGGSAPKAGGGKSG